MFKVTPRIYKAELQEPKYLDDEKYIHTTYIQAEPESWKRGCMITFKIIEVFDYDINLADGTFSFGRGERTKGQVTIYDNEINDCQLKVMLSALASNEVLNLSAEAMIYSLWWQLIVIERQDWLKQHTHEYYESCMNLLKQEKEQRERTAKNIQSD